MSFNNTLFQKYLDYQQPRGSSRRYGECPFCGKANRLAFVVTRTPKGFVCWCHRCHRTTSVNNRVPSARDCLRIADEHMRNDIQPLRKHVKRDPARELTDSMLVLTVYIFGNGNLKTVSKNTRVC